MQPTLGPPREDFTTAQVLGAITSDSVTITPGCELLSSTNQVVEDISADLGTGGSIEWDNRNPVRAMCRVNLTRELAWGRDRIRPFMTFTAVVDGVEVAVRFNLGVYVVSRPTESRGESDESGAPLLTYAVTGYDLLSRLEVTGPAETYVVSPVDDPGITYFEACQAVIAASGIGVQLLLQPDAVDTVVPATRVWAILEPGVSWLRILTDLLAETGYEAPWPDPDGNIHSGPFVDWSVRSSEWTFDPTTADSLVHGDRTIAIETGDGYNAWRFISANATVTPTEGNGLVYIPPPNESEGPNSINALGITKERRKYLQVADAAELIAEGNRIVAADKAAVRVISLVIDPLPLLWANDVVTYTDLGVTEKAPVMSWTLDMDGGTGRIQLGGAPAIPPTPVEVSARGTVTSAIGVPPLTVEIDGTLVGSFANALDAAAYDVGDRVNCTVRNPLPPLILGVES